MQLVGILRSSRRRHPRPPPRLSPLSDETLLHYGWRSRQSLSSILGRVEHNDTLHLKPHQRRDHGPSAQAGSEHEHAEPSSIRNLTTQRRESLRFVCEVSQQGIKCYEIAVAPESGDHAHADRGQHRLFPERLAGVNVREVGLDDR